MTPLNPLVISAALAAVLGLIFLGITVAMMRKRKMIRTLLSFVTMLLMLSLCALFGTITIAIQGYRALVREDLAATVQVRPAGAQTFTARVLLPDGSEKTFSLAGDQLYVDAHILKWKPVANIFGLHTSYELDRIAGRYAALADETAKPHTAFSLARDRPLDMFDLRRKFAALNPLLDAEYGSATFIGSEAPAEFRVLVSTSGLLIRKTEKPQMP